MLVVVPGLGRPEFLIEIEAYAVSATIGYEGGRIRGDVVRSDN
jgi:hypothetical protein